jgi:hypothetical protein
MAPGNGDQDHGGDVAAVVRGLAERGITGLPEQHLVIVLDGSGGDVTAAVAEVAESEWWTVDGWEATWED